MTIKTLFCGTALALSAALVLPSAATAQVSTPVTGIASVSTAEAVFTAKAWAAANNQIQTTYKIQIDSITAKQNQRQTLLAQLDKNGDKQVDDAELAQAQTANAGVLTQIGQLENDINATNQQILLAQAYVLDAIANRFQTGLQTVMTARKISIVLAPGAFVFAPPTIDITKAVVAEIDRTLPVAGVTPPAGWQVTQQGGQLLQQWVDIQQANAEQQAAAQQQRAAAAPPPAATPPAAAGAAPRPATPAAGPPARGGTQQPATR